jgi:hypothetical protein
MRVVGSTKMPSEIWRRMLPAAQGGLFCGRLLDVRSSHGALETGTMQCAYLPEEPLWHAPASSDG